MKNKALYLLLILVVLFRGTLVNLVNNINKLLFVQDDKLEINLLNDKYNKLNKEYKELANFKSNIEIKNNYTITNVYKNNYGFDKLLINGYNYIKGSEVVTDEGLVGVINEIYDKYSDVLYLYNTNLPVIIGEYEGKIMGRDKDNNLIIKEVSNYNNIKINDIVTSTYGTYIGKVIKKELEEIDNKILVKGASYKDIYYVGVISANWLFRHKLK